MSYIQLDEEQRDLTRSQTINSLVVVAVAVLLMAYGAFLRSGALGATQVFVDETSGVQAQIPQGWLLTTENPEFVVQAEDPGAIPFKTLLRITLVPVGEGATLRNVVDTLTLDRSGRLSTYRVLSIQTATIGTEDALEMNYAYVQAEANPFLNAVPVVVRGRDVVLIRGGRAIVLTYREERERFETNEPLFDRFLDTIQFE